MEIAMETFLTVMGFVLGTIWRGRKFVIAFVAVCTLVAIGVALMVPSMYRSSTILIPNQNSSGLSSALGDLSGLVGQFGISAGGDDPSRIYPEILRSREMAHTLLQSRVVDSDSVAGRYLDRLDVAGNSPAAKLENATGKFLESRSRVILNPKNSVLKIVIYDHDPLVAATIANRMAAELDRINQEIGRRNAREKREFIASRRDEIIAELRRAENDLKVFRENNRNTNNSPQLLLELDRINRRVRLGEEMYLTLTRELEMAKIDEIKDVPVIDVLDPALPATSPFTPRRSMIVVTTGLLSGVVAILLVLGWENRRRFWLAFDATGHPDPGE